MNTLEALREQEYQLQQEVSRLRRQVYQQADPSSSQAALGQLLEAEQQLSQLETQISEKVQEDEAGTSGLILHTNPPSGRRGALTTGLESKVYLRMAQVPTSYYHVLNGEKDPLISCEVYATPDNEKPRRVRVTSYIEGYSAKAINTFEIPPDTTHSFSQLPTLYPAQLNSVNELTRAMLNVLIDDLDGKVEIHETYPIWLLARTTAPIAIRDPKTQTWRSMYEYFGAFVTPNAPALMRFLRTAADKHPQRVLVGYQGSPEGVILQVKAIFDALKETAKITYVNSVLDFCPEQGFNGQRVRLPRESLADGQANCIDGTVLFASLLEGISINPAIVLVPGHAFLAWETWRNSGVYQYLETTMIGSAPFEAACASAEKTAKFYQEKLKLTILPLNMLRTKCGILPME